MANPPEHRPKVGSGVGIVLFGAFMMFAGYAAATDGAYYAELDESGKRIDARVMKVRAFETGHGTARTTEYGATVRFTSDDGTSRSGEVKIDEELYEELETGGDHTIPIVYLSEDPDSFRWETGNEGEISGAYIASWVFRILGAIVVLLGLHHVVQAFTWKPGAARGEPPTRASE